MWKCESGHLWKKSDGDICPECPKITCDVCSYTWYTRRGNFCPKCPKWVCDECNHKWYKRDGDKCPKCLPKWVCTECNHKWHKKDGDKCPKCLPKWICAECNHKWYKKDGDECPKCPINLDLSDIKEIFNEIINQQEPVRYFESEILPKISQLLTKYENMTINERKIENEDIKSDEKEKDPISYHDHLRLAVICHSVEEYRKSQYHLRKALKINPAFNDVIKPFEEYGYVEFKDKYIENDINEIIQNGTNNIKIDDNDDEEKKEQKYDEEKFKVNLPYHHSHHFKEKKFEESQIDRKDSKWIYCYGDTYNRCNEVELDFARRICGEKDLEKYIAQFVYFRIINGKKINEIFLREIMDIDDDNHIYKILERLQEKYTPISKEKHQKEKEMKMEDISKERQKYNENKNQIDIRLGKVQQLIQLLQQKVSELKGNGRTLKNEQEINDFMSHMQNDTKQIEKLLYTIKKNKIVEKLDGLKSFIKTIHDIKSIRLIDENKHIKLLNKSWGRICSVYSQSYLYHIEKKTKKDLKIAIRSFDLLNYVNDEELEKYVESLKAAKQCGFEKETELYLKLIESQTKFRKVIQSKKSSFLSMVEKFWSILKNQYYRDRLAVENEMKNVQLIDVRKKITSWSVIHKKEIQQQENVENHIKQKIDKWNEYIAPKISTEMKQIMQLQRIENKQFFDKVERHIHDIFGAGWDDKIKEEFMKIVFISLLIKFSKK